MSKQPTEKELDQALADKHKNSEEFLQWLVSHTKFANRNAAFTSCRSDNPWGTHPYPSKELAIDAALEIKRQSETDVLLIIKAQDGNILGVHIENKIGSGKFTADQPQMYWHRAKHWVGNPHYGGYTEFDTILLAPIAFLERNREQAKLFGCFISHEDIAVRIPLFAGKQSNA